MKEKTLRGDRTAAERKIAALRPAADGKPGKRRKAGICNCRLTDWQAQMVE